MRKYFVLGLLLAALALVLLDASDVDLWLAQAMFDPELQTFPWRHAWLTERLGHDAARRVFTGLGVLALSAALYEALVPSGPWWRARLRIVAWSAVLVPATISALKHISSTHCPWDLAMFGGSAPYVRLFDPAIAGAGHGACFPAGHASSALWLVSLAVFWLPQRPRRAAAVGATMLSLGLVLGWIQQLRGAHFLSHTLWSAWLAMAITGALACRYLARAAPPIAQ